MKLTTAAFSRAGPRHENQDCVLVLENVVEATWSAVADGIGGQPDAAKVANASIERLKCLVHEMPSTNMVDLFDLIGVSLTELAQRGDLDPQSGTTLSVVSCANGLAVIGHVGDLRVYHLRERGIVLRTRDQTEVQELLEQRILTKRQAARYPRRNVLLSALGPYRTPEIYETSFVVKHGDRLLLLTDGAHKRLPKVSLRDLSLISASAEEYAKNVQRAVELAGPDDDYSGIVLQIA